MQNPTGFTILQNLGYHENGNPFSWIYDNLQNYSVSEKYDLILKLLAQIEVNPDCRKHIICSVLIRDVITGLKRDLAALHLA